MSTLFFFLFLKADFENTTWEHIEFQFLEDQLKHKNSGDAPKDFDPILEKFLQISSKYRINGASQGIQSLFEDIQVQ
jgi:hypothetical protein